FLAHDLAAEHTERIDLGTAVAIAFPRSPMATAQIAWDLQRLSNGRFVIGLGTQVKGHIERRYGMTWAAPGPRLKEYVLMMRAIWDSWQNGTKPSFQGEHYRYTLMTPFFNPGAIEHPNIPIHISAINPYNCRLVGEVCDGIKLHGFNTPKYLREVILPNIEKGAKKAGRDLKEIEICGVGFVITGKTEEEVEKAKEPTRQQIAFYASTRTYRPVLDIEGWGELCPELFALSLEGKWQEMATKITDDMLEQFAVIGTYDEIVPMIKERSAGLIDRTTFAIPVRSPEDEERLRSMIKELQAE
ncbi:MAG: TIGR03617 family F420-dependent LLM class oxidoreductase, partial [Chloroflexi bacterium]|nr:TIGR03617 family F420-dependent LLM class oxidoreductase [Chloroflexota bacterium]